MPLLQRGSGARFIVRECIAETGDRARDTLRTQRALAVRHRAMVRTGSTLRRSERGAIREVRYDRRSLAARGAFDESLM